MNRINKDLIKEWLDKADGDFESAISLYKNKRKKNIYCIIAFHCQQAVEKYLKVLLICHKIDFPKIHDLLKLLDLIKEKDPFLNGIKNELNTLNPFAVWFRYPGEDINITELKEVIKVTKKLKMILQKRIKEFV